jgi:hypothetical protein
MGVSGKNYTVLVRLRSRELKNLNDSGHLTNVHLYNQIDVEYQTFGYASALKYYNTLTDEYSNDYCC